MGILEFIELIKRLDGLIRRKNTGSPKELAEKLNLSERQVHRIIKIMKNFCEIEFSKNRNSYVYSYLGKLRVMEWSSEEIDLELKKDGKHNHQSTER
jgi:predicted transcriptional regulator